MKCPQCGVNWRWDWDADLYRQDSGSPATITEVYNGPDKVEDLLFHCPCGQKLGRFVGNPEGEDPNQQEEPAEWEGADWDAEDNAWDAWDGDLGEP